MNPEDIKNQIIQFIKQQTGHRPAVIGLSGGLDSSVVAYLAVEALGADKVYAVMSPSSTNTVQDLELAKRVTKYLNIQYSISNIENIIKTFQNETKLFQNTKSLGNLKARIRMSLLYGKANEIGGIVLGTGNKTELLTGYFTKYGDGGVDLLPIGDLYKTQLRELAKFLSVPREIIDRAPTAGLWEGQTDENEMGITYDELDKILMAIERYGDLDRFDIDNVKKVKQMIQNAEHKLRTVPICIIK